MVFTKEEKEFVFGKIENRKKKIAVNEKNDLYNILHDDSELTQENIDLIKKSLEYSFKKRLSDGPDMKKEIYLTVKEKLS